MIACHLDAELKERLERALTLQGREPDYWPAPVAREDLRRLMVAAGMYGVKPNDPYFQQHCNLGAIAPLVQG